MKEHTKNNEPDEALRVADEVLAAEPDNPRAHMARGWALQRLGPNGSAD